MTKVIPQRVESSQLEVDLNYGITSHTFGVIAITELLFSNQHKRSPVVWRRVFLRLDHV